MKTILFILLSFFLTFSIFSQSTVSIEEKINEVYGPSFFNGNSDGFNFYKRLLSERIQILEEQLTDKDKYPKISEFPRMDKNNSSIGIFSLEDFSIETFNPLYFQLDFTNSKNTQVYRIDGTNYVLVILPQ